MVTDSYFLVFCHSLGLDVLSIQKILNGIYFRTTVQWLVYFRPLLPPAVELNAIYCCRIWSEDTLMYDCSRGSTTVNWSFRDRLTRSRRKECYAAAAYFLSSQPRLEQFLSQLNLTSLHPVFQAKTLDLKCNAFFAWKKNSFHRCRRHRPAAKFNRELTMNQTSPSFIHKVQIFWERHKILKKLNVFWHYLSNMMGDFFFKFCGFLRISEL